VSKSEGEWEGRCGKRGKEETRETAAERGENAVCPAAVLLLSFCRTVVHETATRPESSRREPKQRENDERKDLNSIVSCVTPFYWSAFLSTFVSSDGQSAKALYWTLSWALAPFSCSVPKTLMSHLGE
jgi:hypothetical protein